MNYITRSEKGIIVSSKNDTYYPVGLIQYLNNKCINELSTYKGRIDSVRKLFGFIATPPLLINKENILFFTKSIRNYDCLLINYCSVLSYRKDNDYSTKIVFANFEEIIVQTKYSQIKKQYQKAEIVYNYRKNKSF